MEFKTYIKQVRVSPKKLRFILDDVKKMKPANALDHLLYSPKRGAKILYKAIKTALDTAEKTGKIDRSALKFKMIWVDGGQFLKRFRAGGRGVAKPYKKRSSHINIILKTDDKNLTKSK